MTELPTNQPPAPEDEAQVQERITNIVTTETESLRNETSVEDRRHILAREIAFFRNEHDFSGISDRIRAALLADPEIQGLCKMKQEQLGDYVDNPPQRNENEGEDDNENGNDENGEKEDLSITEWREGFYWDPKERKAVRGYVEDGEEKIFHYSGMFSTNGLKALDPNDPKNHPWISAYVNIVEQKINAMKELKRWKFQPELKGDSQQVMITYSEPGKDPRKPWTLQLDETNKPSLEILNLIQERFPDANNHQGKEWNDEKWKRIRPTLRKWARRYHPALEEDIANQLDEDGKEAITTCDYSKTPWVPHKEGVKRPPLRKRDEQARKAERPDASQAQLRKCLQELIANQKAAHQYADDAGNVITENVSVIAAREIQEQRELIARCVTHLTKPDQRAVFPLSQELKILIGVSKPIEFSASSSLLGTLWDGLQKTRAPKNPEEWAKALMLLTAALRRAADVAAKRAADLEKEEHRGSEEKKSDAPAAEPPRGEAAPESAPDRAVAPEPVAPPPAPAADDARLRQQKDKQVRSRDQRIEEIRQRLAELAQERQKLEPAPPAPPPAPEPPAAEPSATPEAEPAPDSPSPKQETPTWLSSLKNQSREDQQRNIADLAKLIRNRKKS